MKPHVPSASKSAESSESANIGDDPDKPDSNTAEYMQQFYRYHHEYVQYRKDLETASGIIIGLLDTLLKHRYSDDKWDYDPSGLWNEIKKERDRVLKIDGKQLMDRLNSIKLSDFGRTMQYYTEIRNIIRQLDVCDVKLTEKMIAYFMLNSLPTTNEWTSFAISLSNDRMRVREWEWDRELG